MTEPTPEIALVEQLRRLAACHYLDAWGETCTEAADLLSRLGRERDEARAKAAIDEAGYDDMTVTASNLIERAEAAKAEVERLGREHRALREWVEKWRNRADRGFDPEEAPETTAYWAAIRRFTDELDAVLASPSPATTERT